MAASISLSATARPSAERRRHPDFPEAGSHGPTRIIPTGSGSGCTRSSPMSSFFFEAANITNQILNFGLPAPIDVQVVGRDAAAELQDRAATRAAHRADSGRGGRACSPGGGLPRRSRVNVDRTKAGQLGLDAARCCQQPADFAQRQRAGGAQPVAELGQRRQLPVIGANAAIQDRFAGRADAHADFGAHPGSSTTSGSHGRHVGRQ